MKIVTTYHNLHTRFSIEKIIEMLSQAGFDGIDFTDIPIMTEVWSDSYKEYAGHLNNVAQSFGIEFTQTHGPIVGVLMKEFDSDMQKCIDRTYRSIEFTSLIGAKNVVIHPIQDPLYATESERVFEKNMEFFSKLASCAENYGVNIAIENMVMPSLDGTRKRDGVCADPAEFKKYIDALNSKFVTGCLDFGHSALSGRQPQDMLRSMGGDYITSTHIHDNDFVSDSHQLPCTMKMNWDEICKAMAEIGYSGDFTLEAVCFFNNFADEFIPEVLKFMYQTSKYLTDKIDEYKMKIN